MDGLINTDQQSKYFQNKKNNVTNLKILCLRRIPEIGYEFY